VALSLMNMLGLVKRKNRTYSMLLKILPFALHTSPRSVEALQSRSCLSKHILCYNGSLVTWMVLRLTAAKFKPFIFSMSGFTLSYTANMLLFMILYDFCFLPTQVWCCITQFTTITVLS
jgi:hypothetical protein